MEDKELQANDGRDPDFTFKNPSSSKGGVFETFVRVSKKQHTFKLESIY